MQMTAAAAWLNSCFAEFDSSITLAVHQLYLSAGDLFTPFFDFISFLGKGGIVLILLSLALMFFKKTRRFGTAMLISVTVGAIFTNLVLKVAIARPRPYADEGDIFYQLWLLVGQRMESDMSFPSGHTTAAFATMTPVFLVGNKRISWTAFIFAFLMGIARIYLVVHFPTDVVAGVLVGVLAGVVGTLISRKISPKYYEANLFKRKKGEDAQCSVS